MILDNHMAAPVNRLPPEILSWIFVILVRDSRHAASIRDKSYDGVDYLFRLSSVCAHWRQVATSTSTLWSFLDICGSEYPLEYTEYLNVRYKRSGSAPLSLRLGKYDDRYDHDAVEEQLVPILSSSAARLESLIVAYTAPGFAKELLSFLLTQKAAARVRELAIESSREDDVILADVSLPQYALNEILAPLQSLYLERVSFD